MGLSEFIISCILLMTIPKVLTAILLCRGREKRMKVMCTEFMGWNIDAAIADFNPEISSVLTTCDGVLCVLECSQCVSDPSGDCANTPPPATPCNSLEQHRGPVNCIVAKKKNASGFVVQFIRGCIVVRRSGGCLKQIDNSTLCYNICTTDNCNSGRRHRSFPVYIFLLLIVNFIKSQLI